MGNFLTCDTQQGLMDIYISSPEASEKLPIVLVFQEVFGVNSFVRSVCDRLAKEGYLAVAPEFFHREGRRIEVSYGDRETSMKLLTTLSNETILQDIEATLQFLPILPTADIANINTIGFCVGGFCSILAATRFPVKKAVSFYGSGMVRPREGIALKPILDDFKHIQSECLFIFGGQDSSIPTTDRIAIEKKLMEEKIPFRMETFPKSDHGFFCHERKSYNQQDAAEAWKRTLSFLKSDYSKNNITENLRKSKSLLSSDHGTYQRPRDSRESDQQI